MSRCATQTGSSAGRPAKPSLDGRQPAPLTALRNRLPITNPPRMPRSWDPRDSRERGVADTGQTRSGADRRPDRPRRRIAAVRDRLAHAAVRKLALACARGSARASAALIAAEIWTLRRASVACVARHERASARARAAGVRRDGRDRDRLPLTAPRRACGRSAAARKARTPCPGRLSQPGDPAGADRAPRHRGRVPQRAQCRAARRRTRSARRSTRCRRSRRRQGARAALDRDRPGGRRGLAAVAAAHPHAADRRHRGAASRPRRAAARGPAIRGAAGARPCGARRQPQLRAGGRPEPRRAESGGPPHAASRRARSRPIPAVVTEVAGLYCATLQAHRRALHAEAFPRPRPRLRGHPQGHRRTRRAPERARGIGLASVPAIDGGRTAFTMLGHARLTALDRDRPASFSHAVVKGLLRDSWKHDGILVTDDFSMGAVTLEPRGRRAGRDRGAQCRRRPDPGQLRSGSVFPRDARPAGGRSRRRACGRKRSNAERRTAAPGRGTLSRHQLRTFCVKSIGASRSPQSLIRP